MKKEEYRESHERDMELYYKSILSRDEDKNSSQSMDDYEWHIGHFED